MRSRAPERKRFTRVGNTDGYRVHLDRRFVSHWSCKSRRQVVKDMSSCDIEFIRSDFPRRALVTTGPLISTCYPTILLHFCVTQSCDDALAIPNLPNYDARPLHNYYARPLHNCSSSLRSRPTSSSEDHAAAPADPSSECAAPPPSWSAHAAAPPAAGDMAPSATPASGYNSCTQIHQWHAPGLDRLPSRILQHSSHFLHRIKPRL